MMTRRGRVRHGSGLALVLASLFLSPVAGAEGREARSPWSFGVSAQGEVIHDDNILSLSDRDKGLVGDPNPANTGRFRIESPDDFIFAPDLTLTFARSPRRGRETDIVFTVRAHDYVRNSVKDYQDIALSVRQELTRSRAHQTALKVGISRIPSYYLRELIDEDESPPPPGPKIRNSLTYEKSRAFLELTQEVLDRTLSVTGRYAREKRDYNDHFNERDSDSDVLSLDASVYPMRRIGLRIRPYYAREKRGSHGDLDSSPGIVDDDVGYDSDLFGVEVRGLWGRDADHRHTLRAYYEDEEHTFTTSIIGDDGHFGRVDSITKFGVGYEKEIGAAWAWGASAYHRDNDVSLPSQPTIGHAKNVVAASLTYSFERRIKRTPKPGGEPRAPEQPETDG